jgi:hypothetical protein
MMHQDDTSNNGQNDAEGRIGEVTLDPKVQEALGRSLKAHYEDLIKAPIPDKFLVLLAELEAKEQRHDK